jgi:DNA-binding HxlR family transcriptional regulator
MSLIGTKWKPLILFHLLDGGLRSGLLQKKISGISNKMFTQTVRELEKRLISRKNFSGSSSQSGIQIDRERKIARKYFTKFGSVGR